jgi:hypothetical protein
MRTLIQNPSAICASVLISALGATFYNVLPMLVGAAQEDLGFSSWQIGLIPTAFFSGWVLFAGSGYLWLHRANLRVVALGASGVAMSALLLSLHINHFQALLGLTFIAGGGFSCVYGIGTHLLGLTLNPTRWYGLKIAVEPMPGMVILFALPATAISANIFSDILWAMIFVSALLSVAIFFIPSVVSSSEITEDKLAGANDHGSVVLALISVFLFFSAASGMWAFLERLGAARDFDQDYLSALLGITLITATSGSLLTAWMGDRYGNLKPFILSAMFFLASIFTLALPLDMLSFGVAAGVMTFVVGAGLPLIVAEVAARDIEHRLVIMTVPAVGLGAMLGPPVVGFLADGQVFATAIFACGILALLSILTARH